MIFRVDCSKGCTYTQEIDSNRNPVVCGACGCKIIRVWKIAYDSWTEALQAEIRQKRELWMPTETH